MSEQTKICSTCKTEKPLSDYHAQKAGKYGVTSRCKACQSEYAKQHYVKNNDRIDAQQAKYVQENISAVRQRQRDRYSKNVEQERIRSKAYRDKNIEKERARQSSESKKARRRELYAESPGKYLNRNAVYRNNNPEVCKQSSKLWQMANLHRFQEYKARRRSKEELATPKWADRKKIMKIYEDAAEISRSTGVRHSVDHIVPINSPIVCGLHCEANLEVKLHKENLSKGNRYWPDMP